MPFAESISITSSCFKRYKREIRRSNSSMKRSPCSVLIVTFDAKTVRGNEPFRLAACTSILAVFSAWRKSISLKWPPSGVSMSKTRHAKRIAMPRRTQLKIRATCLKMFAPRLHKFEMPDRFFFDRAESRYRSAADRNT